MGKYAKIIIIAVVIFCFSVTTILAQSPVRNSKSPAYGLPAPSEMLALSQDYSLPVLKGMRIDPGNSGEVGRTEVA